MMVDSFERHLGVNIYSGEKIEAYKFSFVVLLFSIMIIGTIGTANAETIQSPFTTSPPIIDGVISPNEWNNAEIRTVTFSYIDELYPSTLYMMNDGTNFYFALTVTDNDYHNGDHIGIKLNDGYDFLYIQGSNFKYDGHKNSTNYITFDTNQGGTNDIDAISSYVNSNNMIIYTFEISHPIDSTDDANDVSLSMGDSVSMNVFFLDMNRGFTSSQSSIGTINLVLGSGSPFIPCGNTLTGQNIATNPTANVDVNFDSISACGDTTAIVQNSNQGTPLPNNYNHVMFYDIDTTAIYSNPITVKITYSVIPSNIDENSLKLFHYEGGNWVDVTTSLNTASKTLTGRVTSLSPFAVAGTPFGGQVSSSQGPVGGITIPVNKPALLAPYIAFASVGIFSIALIGIFLKRRKE